MVVSFERFGPAHLWAIALTMFAPLVLCAFSRSSRSGVADRMIRWLFVALLVGDEILRYFLLRRHGALAIETIAPMHLCDWAAITAVITLVHPNQRTYELCYFWALGGTLQALITPDLPYGFPDLRFINFFALHGGVIASALYMTLCLGMRPVAGSLPRVLGWSAVYLAAAVGTNFVFKTNFGYLREKPSHPSLFDYMAPWPFYIAQLIPLAIAFCLVCYLPFFLIDRLQGGDPRTKQKPGAKEILN